MSAPLRITGNPDADELLSTDSLALLIGMLLDQQVPMETAFAGPWKLRERLGELTAQGVTEQSEERLIEVFRTPPAVHRYPAAMAERTKALCAVVQEQWDGNATAIWTRDAPDGREVLRRLKGLPGFGEQKAKIFLAVLGKLRGLTADGWRDAAAPYGEPGSFRSVADIVDPDSLERVREFKRAAKATAKNR